MSGLAPKRRSNARKFCKGCPFHGPKVGWRGNPEAPVVIVGESPGPQEVREGLPFFEKAPSGSLLWGLVPGGTDADVLVTNALECSPPQKTKDQTVIAEACGCCHDRLVSQITAYPRRIILALGNAAAWSLTGDFGIKITQDRGQTIPSELAQLGIMPIVHPAALFHGSGSFRQFKGDLEYSFHLASGGRLRTFTEP
ncbi:MAG: uracil-DNA glycosylase family protein, partial [Thermoplasmata archaeon]